MESDSRKTLLLVEDEALIALSERRALEEHGYRVIVEDSGEGAIAAVAGPDTIDLVLMDLDLGRGMDGAEAAKGILGRRELPIVFLSSHSEQAMVAKTETIRSYGFVLKGSPISVLDASIRIALRLFEAPGRQDATEAHVRENAERLGLTMQAASMAWWEMDVQTGLVGFDRKKTDMLGYEPEGFGHFGDFMKLLHPGDSEKAMEAMRRHLYDGAERYDIEYRIMSHSGEYHWFHDLGSVTGRDGEGRPTKVSGIVLDIAERKKAEEDIKHEQHLMSALMDNVPDLIYFKDRESRFIRVNKALAVTLGLSDTQEAIGKTDFDFYSEDAARQFLEDERQILDTGWPITKTEQAEWPNKTISWNLTTKMPLSDIHGRIVGTFGISTDITEQVTAKTRVQALLSEKELLLREVHHRIKNNFNNITAMLTLQSDRFSDPASLAVVQETISQIDGMRLLYERLNQGGSFDEMPVKEFLTSLVHQVVGHFPEGSSVGISTDIEDFVLDTRRLQSLAIILNEVITNIMKYAFLGIPSPRIVVVATEEDGHMRISVSDNGRGLPESMDFEHSTGFGLALIGGIARQLNGSISVVRSGGTTIVLEFDR